MVYTEDEFIKVLKNNLGKYLDGTQDKPAHDFWCEHGNEVWQVRTIDDNPLCPICGAVMTYGKYF